MCDGIKRFPYGKFMLTSTTYIGKYLESQTVEKYNKLSE